MGERSDCRMPSREAIAECRTSLATLAGVLNKLRGKSIRKTFSDPTLGSCGQIDSGRNMTFEKKYLKSGPDQISLQVLRSTFGIPRFFKMEGGELQNQRFEIPSAPMVVNFAIAWTGTLFLEIIQPLTPDAI